MRWTQPFHGVQHLIDFETKALRQITLIDRGSFAEVYAIGPVGFTAIWEEDAETVAEAMAQGEAYARQFLPIKKEDPQCESGFAQD